MPVIPPPKGPPGKQPEKPPWVKETTEENPSPIRRVKTPPPSTANQKPVDVPWRKPALKKTNPDPPLLPEPVKKEAKPEWATKKRGSIDKQKSIDKPSPKEKTEKAIPIKVESKSSKKPEPAAPAPINKKVDRPQESKPAMQNGKPPPAPPPPPPGGMPPPPPPPPPPGGKPPSSHKTPEQLARIEELRKHPRRRPDPYQLMKEIQSGRKLKHVECNDRSKPILQKTKSSGKFMFESEVKPASKADAIHNKLLDQISHGVKLKKVTTNDRSKPILSGLRKFRRQATLDEIKESEQTGSTTSSAAPLMPLGMSDDIDDIDILRDDLQSAKQLLELELQSKVELGKVNQELQCQIITLEAEIDKMKAQLGIIPEDQVAAICRRNSRAFKDIRKSRSGLYRSSSGIKKSKSGIGDKAQQPNDLEEDSAMEEMSELQEEVTALKGLVQIARKSAEDWEAKFKEASQKLLVAQGNLEDSEQKRILLEKKLEIAQRRRGVSATPTLEKFTQTEELQLQPERRTSKQMAKGTSFSYDSGSEDEGSDVEVDEATILKNKQEREIKLWENKLKSIKDKQVSSRTERKTLKAQQKKMEQDLKDAKVKHKQLQKEVDKMAKALKESLVDSDDEAEEEEEEEESEEESEESTEEESEESEEEEEEPEESSSEEDDSDAEHDERINSFTNRAKRHENILNALKKGNYLLKANIDRLMDDLEDVKIKHLELEHELNTVLNAC